MGRGVGSAGFREQVVGLGYLWETWSEAEQVVVVYSLVRRLGPVPARFLLNVLNAHTTAPDAADLNNMEATANDPAWVSQIPEAKDGGASDLLHHLPLLRPSNTEAKLQYLSIIPKVLAHAVTSAGSQPAALENARQILSYSLIHPAITADERRALTHWLRALEDRLADLRRRPQTQQQQQQQQRDGLGSTCNIGSTSNLATVKSHWTEPPLIPPPDTGQQDDTGWCGGGAIAIGCSGDQSPNNSATSSRSSGCDSNPEEPCQPHPGMRDVGVWLKSLRLHKYSPLLCNLTYEELLALDESTLESQGVTKGARHKIVLSISKLKERHKQLVQIEKEVMNGGNLFSCLNDLKSIILTPFPPYNPPSEPAQLLSQPSNTSSSIPDPATSPPPPTLPVSSSTPPVSTNPLSYSTSSTTTASSASSLSTSASSSACSLRGDDRELIKEEKEESIRPATVEGESNNSIPENDLPSQFTRVMGKVCTQLLVSVRPEDECVSAFLGLVEKCVNHEAFTAAHARRLQSWKLQIIRVWHPLPPKTKDSRHTRRWSQQYGGDGFVGGSFRVPRVSGQRHTHIPAGLLMGGKGFGTPQPHPLFPLPPAAAAAACASLGGLMSPRNSLPGLPSLGIGGLLSPQQFLAKRPSLQETPSELRPHITLQRTRSAPSRPHQLPLIGHTRPVPLTMSSSLAPGSGGGCGEIRIPGTTGTVLEPHFSPASSYSNLGPPPPSSPDLADNDITDRLESLCLSVTEHALG